ncbi:MAG TPA: hypothetical protein VN948_13170 [Terriglobales bacterium]|nr:hypothetical protein [Terriglobales bacterium]
MSELKHEVYRTIFETWRYEVDSYWQRNNYFAAFETVALAGCWYVVEHKHLWSGLAFSLLGVVSTIVWLITSIAVHRYIAYWWQSIKDIEAVLSLQDCKFAFATEHPGSGLHPSWLVHVIPILFMAAWIVIVGLAFQCLCSCKGC